ncbi:hypothetical protein E3N88_42110 [Mikania micrantha]|uniref:Uncharacterized protein n=1 Tax=Mikania micrantha TaxID=192012 RepID=A0A5N6LIR7_9ASTR|nr:hypothetical protein E3N88_42110 [Mikania micrantha]
MSSFQPFLVKLYWNGETSYVNGVVDYDESTLTTSFIIRYRITYQQLVDEVCNHVQIVRESSQLYGPPAWFSSSYAAGVDNTTALQDNNMEVGVALLDQQVNEHYESDGFEHSEGHMTNESEESEFPPPTTSQKAKAKTKSLFPQTSIIQAFIKDSVNHLNSMSL